MILHKSFKHGWFYHYRLHKLNADEQCTPQFSPLNNYLNSVLESCPEEKFNKIRSSKLKFAMPFEVMQVENHEITDMARLGLEGGDKSAHTNVQLHMLNHDPKTIAVEVPLWLDAIEHQYHDALFGSQDPLSGHIDVLRIEGDKIWVWDFKPKAHLEKYASTQTFFYAMMLSKRTGIPLDDFRCGYFDENTAYMFKPDVEMLKGLKF